MSARDPGDQFLNLTATGTAFTGRGVLTGIMVNDPGSTVTMTVFDNTIASGTKVCTAALTAGMCLTFGYGILLGTGCRVVLSGAADVTVAFRQ